VLFVARACETERINRMALAADETSIDTPIQRHGNFSYDPCLAGAC
jgi:hypothetical protein